METTTGILIAHIVRETGRSPPPTPSIFFKPNTTVADHGSDVVIPKLAQDEQADYEGELVSGEIKISGHQQSALTLDSASLSARTPRMSVRKTP